MNCGSFDSFQVSCRCGCNPNARQIRETTVCDRPTSAARGRVDQGVASFGVVSNVVVTACSASASAMNSGGHNYYHDPAGHNVTQWPAGHLAYAVATRVLARFGLRTENSVSR